MIDFELNFPRYTEGESEVPVWCGHFNLLMFNTMYQGSRGVFYADMREFQDC